jgi:hypothetical protein
MVESTKKEEVQKETPEVAEEEKVEPGQLSKAQKKR